MLHWQVRNSACKFHGSNRHWRKALIIASSLSLLEPAALSAQSLSRPFCYMTAMYARERCQARTWTHLSLGRSLEIGPGAISDQHTLITGLIFRATNKSTGHTMKHNLTEAHIQPFRNTHPMGTPELLAHSPRIAEETVSHHRRRI
jgi:hypothetical protein